MRWTVAARSPPTSVSAGTCWAAIVIAGRAVLRGSRLSLSMLSLVYVFARALTWHRAIGAGDPDEVEDDWVRGPIESMVSLLDASYLGRV